MTGDHRLYMAPIDRRGIIFPDCADSADRVAVRSMAVDAVEGDTFVDWRMIVSEGKLSSGHATGVLDMWLQELQNSRRLGSVLPSFLASRP